MAEPLSFGQCPECRTTHAFVEAELDAARGEWTCDCGVLLTVSRFGDGEEIEVVCPDCETDYAIDPLGAGLEIECCCGKGIIVPTFKLTVRTTAPASTESADLRGSAEAEPSGSSARLPIVAAPTLHQIGLPPRPEAATEVRSLPQTIRLPIVAVPQVHSIQIKPPTPIDVVHLPVVATPMLYTIEPPDDVGIDEEIEDHSPAITAAREQRLPIVASPTLHSIRVDAPPPSRTPETVASHDTPSENARLPIVAAPILHAISIPSASVGIPAEQEDDTASGPDQSDHMDLECPGCSKRYRAPRSREGESAECECGFVFVMHSNVDAFDVAFKSPLIRHLPIAIDRTGNVAAESNRDPDTQSQAEPVPATPPEHDPPRAFPIRSFVVAACLLVAVGVAVAMKPGQPPMPSKTDDQSVAAKLPSIGQPRPTAPKHPTTEPRAPSELLSPLREIGERLESQPQLGVEPLQEFAIAVSKLSRNREALQAPDVFWIGDQWERLAERAATGDLASKCYYQAAAAYSLGKSLQDLGDDEIRKAEWREAYLLEKSRDPGSPRTARRGI